MVVLEIDLDLFVFQLKLIYSTNSVLSKYLKSSSVQAFRYTSPIAERTCHLLNP